MRQPSSRRVNPNPSTRRPLIEGLEARWMLHAGHDHGAVDVPAPVAASATAVRIDAGSVKRDFVSAGGPTWNRDVYYTGGKAARGKFRVAGTADAALYASRRTGKAFAYAIPATNGSYTVTLAFVDTVKKPGKRLFNVDLEGQRVETNLDVASAVGGAARTLLLRSFVANVVDGAINLGFSAAKGKAILSAIEVVANPPQPTPPAAPSGLGAQVESPSSVALTWADNSADETGFEIERATGGSAFAPLVTVGAGVVRPVDGGLVADQAYSYRVRAIGAGGASAWTEAVTVTIPGEPQPVAPGSPSGLTASAVGPTEVALGWADNSDNESGFVVERAPAGGAFAVVATLGPDATSHRDTTAEPQQAYTYRIVAVNAAGQSGPSNEVAVTTPAQAPVNSNTVNWRAARAAPVGRSEAMGEVVNGKLYVFGGYVDNTFRPSRRGDVYDPATDTWGTIANLPVGLSHAGVASDGTVIWVAGGYPEGPTGGANQLFSTNKVWKFDTVANSWTAGPNLPAARGGGALVRLGRELHFFGGSDPARVDSGSHWSLALDDPAATWVARASLQVPRNHLGGAALNGLIYAVGGQNNQDAASVFRSDVEAWDPATDTWRTVAPLPVPPRSHIAGSTFVHNGRIITLGGEGTGHQVIASASAYDPATNTWSNLTNLPAARLSGVGGSLGGNQIIFTGGVGRFGSNFDYATDNWIGEFV